MDDLVVLLQRGKLEHRLLEFFPPEKRTAEKFNQHFKDAGLLTIVEYAKNLFDANTKREMQESLMAAISEEEPVAEVIKAFNERKETSGLSELDALKVVWNSLMDSLSLTGKNQQQVQFMVLKQVKVWNKLLGELLGAEP